MTRSKRMSAVLARLRVFIEIAAADSSMLRERHAKIKLRIKKQVDKIRSLKKQIMASKKAGRKGPVAALTAATKSLATLKVAEDKVAKQIAALRSKAVKKNKARNQFHPDPVHNKNLKALHRDLEKAWKKHGTVRHPEWKKASKALDDYKRKNKIFEYNPD
jgi:hypothetical protein